MAEDIQRTLGRIEGKLDDALRRSDVQDTRLDNHSSRLGSLEKWQGKLIGGFAVISIVVGFLVKLMK